MLDFVHRIPIATTVFSAYFFVIIFRHARARGFPPYLVWWTFGVLCYGLGTLTESLITLFGWHPVTFKAWYILGALLGGLPLAQGSVYLLWGGRSANISSVILLAVILITGALIVASPIDYSLVESARPTGKVLVWKEVRWVTPFINLYALFFLVGGASYSAYRYSRDARYSRRFVGNLFIAIGGLLPGVGGTFTKFGYTEVLYVTELIGILFIFAGYHVIRQEKSMSLFEAQTQR